VVYWLLLLLVNIESNTDAPRVIIIIIMMVVAMELSVWSH